nr:cytidylate kinase family protein [uncultured Blautia sp.]
MNKLKRYVIFLIGLFVNSLGVSLITKASLGTSPISSIPYVLSLSFPFTLGNFTIFFSIFLILLQLLILRKNFKLEHVLQIPVSIVFGYFIDLTMLLFAWVNPQAYIMKIIYLLIGCLILGFGVYMEVLADVVMLPGESFVRAIVLTWKTNFGTTKVCFDVSMSVIAAILSFVFTGRLNGVREGTIIAALLVGFIARVLGKKLAFVKPLLFPEEHAGEHAGSGAQVQPDGETAQRNVIVIGRQFGSGGHDIGQALAEKLGFAFYDQEIIEMTAGTTGYTPEFIQKNEEMMTSSFLYDLVNQMYMYAQPDEEAPKDKIYEAESKVVKELAAKGNCVIVGRCSDYTLRDNKNCLRVFFSAPMENRMKRVMERLHLSEKDAKQKIQKEDKWRADNYRYYTGRIWGAAGNFDLTLNTALGEEYIEMCIREAMKR